MPTVMGAEPLRVPSQPGMAMEKRPAVPPATTTCISLGEGNLEMSSSGAGVCALAKRKFVPSPLSSSGRSVR